MVQKLDNMEALRDSGFGRPWPRHGLNLLYWFAKDYIVFNTGGQMVTKYNPGDGQFGFRFFHNNPLDEDKGKKRLLPYVGNPFYEVGNLQHDESNSLPEYVRKNYGGYKNSNNMDRLIISIQPDGIVDKVYVTQHDDLTTFDPDNTFYISRRLLMTISGYKRYAPMSLNVFLEQVGYSHTLAQSLNFDASAGSRSTPNHTPMDTEFTQQKNTPEPDSWCNIL